MEIVEGHIIPCVFDEWRDHDDDQRSCAECNLAEPFIPSNPIEVERLERGFIKHERVCDQTCKYAYEQREMHKEAAALVSAADYDFACYIDHSGDASEAWD